MAKRKHELIARVRYIKGKPEPEKTGKWDDDEQFIIEVWDEEHEAWSFDTGARLWHCTEYPKEEAEMIHFSFMRRILQMLSYGYKFHEASSEDA